MNDPIPENSNPSLLDETTAIETEGTSLTQRIEMATVASEVSADLESADEEWELVEEELGSEVDSATPQASRPRKKRRIVRTNDAELRLQGRRELCKNISEVAPSMLKTVKLRILGNFLDSTRGLEDDDLTQIIKKQANKLADGNRILTALNRQNADFERVQLEALFLSVLLQEETYSSEENKIDLKLIELEKEITKKAKSFDMADLKKRDPDRWHHFDTYRIVLEAAWGNDNLISPDEARLLGVLRKHLGISLEEHWLISALIKRFPKEKGITHTPDEVNEVRKDLQRAGIVWSFRDETNQNIDVIPGEIAAIIRMTKSIDLQRTNYRRLLNHDSITMGELRAILANRAIDKSGSKPELIDRLAASAIRPTEVLTELDKDKLSSMCGSVSLKTSGSKAELIDRLICFYDDLTFEERISKDEREVWYNNYELLAGRKYAELRAKKLISKDLEIQSQFEHATTYLVEKLLHAKCDRSHKDNRADGRIHLDNNQCLLWDCKSVEVAVNLQEYLESQFDGYLRKETEIGKTPLAFLVIAPCFTPQSVILAHQYKARTNWDIALITAEGLKHLADRWAATEPTKPFPVRLLNRTELIDKDRAEFLLSLA